MVTFNATVPDDTTPASALPTPAVTPIAVAEGDGIGPEIMQATLRVLDAAGAKLDVQHIAVGVAAQARGFSSGIEPSAWGALRRTKVLLKAPVSTPQGKGLKSLNVTVRKALGLFANVRPCRAYAPFVRTLHPQMDVVVIRENEEDVYAGIEHRQTDDVVQCLKLMSATGSERLIRYACEYARANGRRKVTCMTKDNIMKMTDGMFHRVFEEVAAEYPDLEAEHLIVDIGAARLATRPETFDVLVLPNLYGDILSDVAAELAGSIGMASSANIGAHVAMFEAVHGSAPDLAGKDAANPSGLLLAAVQMLAHIGQPSVAARVHNAWLRTIEEGVHTPDIHSPASTMRVGTQRFADEVIARLGLEPTHLKPVRYTDARAVAVSTSQAPRPTARKELIGVDVFVHFREPQPSALATILKPHAGPAFSLQMITNRGVMVWPDGQPETYCTDHWRCRFRPAPGNTAVRPQDVAALLARFAAANIEFIKTEHLYTFNEVAGFSLGQGE
ncbi:MAG: NADP-dependent isocitrate dehydrogenase [Cyanobacteria bacterium]|nr:NADP-dependent isocitrate dehydrogenase [Cyanobacteriota bacterium]